MTFATHKDTPGRQAASVLELDLDYCENSYGLSPCTAFLALTNNVRESETIDSGSWIKGGSTVTPNAQNNPLDGAATADDVFETAATGVHRIQQIAGLASIDPTQAQTVAVYVRPIGGRDRIKFQIFNASVTVNRFSVLFSLSEQTITSSFGEGDGEFIGAEIYPEGPDGYYRIVATGIPDTLGGVTDGINYQIRFLDDAGQQDYLGDVTKGFTIYGATHRLGLKPGKYLATTSVGIDNNGVVDDLCFNAFGNCQDTPNFIKQVRTLRFIDTLQRPYQFLDAYPAILSVRYAPTVLKPGGNLSIRGQVTVTLQDFTTTDNELDDYVVERSYNPEDQGTFFGKLKARHNFYIGRPMRVLEGYLDDATLADFRTREYIIDDISGPTADGKVTIKGKDILSLASDVRAKAPTASTNTLRAAMNTSQTTLLPQTGEAVNMLAGDKHVRINDEIIELVSESPTDTLNVVRQKGGTPPAAHVIDDGIQECLTYENTPIIDVVQELLQTFANVPASFIPFTDWELEETETLSGYDVETIISEPTGVLTLLKEIAAITLLDIWYDDIDQEVKLKLQTPFTSVSEVVNDDDDILQNSLKVKDLNAQRLTRVLIYYGMRNFARDLTETENYSLINFQIEADKEGVNKYNDERIKVIFSRWFDASNSVQVALTSQRLLDRFGITPKAIEFDLDAKDVERLRTGDVFDLTSRIEQALDGTKATNRYQVTETKAIKPGSQYRYKCDAFFQDPQPDSLIISTNQTNFDLFVELGGPPGPIDVTLTINTGVNVDGLNGSPAITTAGIHPDSTLTIINNGAIRGYGGNGGDGISATLNYEDEGSGCVFSAQKFDGAQGQAGGDALNTTIDVTIDNTNGDIFAGAGAGGGGDSHAPQATISYGGGGGGGGLGTDTGNAGAAGTGFIDPFSFGSCGIEMEADGVVGTAGSTTAAGTGGLKGGTGAGNGGDGGADWGETGSVGGAGGTSPGIGGFAVRLNGNSIVWTGGNNPTQVKGSVA